MIRNFNRSNILFLALIILLLNGCASSMMTQVKKVENFDDKQSLITFIRPSSFGGAIQFSLWDGEKFIGILSAKSYVQYLAEPGDHIFLSRAENWSYIKASLAPGKKYYILGRVFPGLWKARVALDPVTKSDDITDDEIGKWMAKLKPTAVISEKVDDYVKPRVSDVEAAVDQFEAGKVKYEEMMVDDNR